MEEKKLNVFEQNADSENIEEVIKNSGKVTEDIVAAAANKIADKKKEKVTQQLIYAVQHAEYVKMATLLEYRRSNRVNKLKNAYLKAITELVDGIKTGKNPVTDWEKESFKLKDKLNQDIREEDLKYEENKKELDELFPDSWNYKWSSLIPRR